MDIFGILRRLPEIVAYNKFDDDLYDRLNYAHTVVILTVFAIIVTNKQFSENQIKCWVPAQFTGNYESYVNQICFITNTYSFDMHEMISDDDQLRHERELKYYQWTPFILLLMAILFYVPHQLWRGLSLRSGVDIKDLIDAAYNYRSSTTRRDDRIKLLDYICNWLNGYCSNGYRISIHSGHSVQQDSKKKQHRFLHIIRRIKHVLKYLLFPVGIYTGNYLVISYLFIKFLYLLNSIGQILLLNALLGRQFWYYGVELIHRYLTKQIGLLHTGSEYFPKVVLCDFNVREPNHPKESHRYTVQCVLPFNLFNQQIFTYLWFWLVLLSLFNGVSIVIWLYRMSPFNNLQYLERRLPKLDEADIRRVFVYRYLQGDGTFMLRLIASNVSDYVCNKVIAEVYKTFKTAFESGTIEQQTITKRSKTPVNENIDDNNKHKPHSEVKSQHNSTNNDDDQQTRVDRPIYTRSAGYLPTEGVNVEHLSSTTEDEHAILKPLPIIRTGKLSIERNTIAPVLSASTSHPPYLSSSEYSDNSDSLDTTKVSYSIILPRKEEQQSTPKLRQRNETSLKQDELQTDKLSLNKIRRMSDTQIDITSKKNVDFNSETKPSITTPTPTMIQPFRTTIPTPYATTYLPLKTKNLLVGSEAEMPYIDDSIASSSSARSTTLASRISMPETQRIVSFSGLTRSHDV
ncbi:unnamed protein product [Didymodactylos carnosus]|uniref:Innexin n=1 Tax=Didymodactylos carnosus TaxID=1234261 RepID=A0A813SYF8_9BILA|nr:unnamed protein product [Didymodactylos carnosus]CAF0936518.1 unnamed protein product [Didymodactylos carnosus]CAF3587758.1 unnamed protein product [Didymodactylos carnosus]CAF3712126.1 unnamed protein product [Didymodactylos carnosus]